MALTRGQLWRSARDRFAAGHIENGGLDARVLLQFSLGIDQTQLIASETVAAREDEIAAYDVLVARRLAREPVARIIGRQEFYGLDFGLNAATLVPRPETEMLVDFGIDLLAGRDGAHILDLGTGTGCIVLALLANLPGARGVGVDLSPQAVAQAQENARALGLDKRFEAIEGNWFSPIAGQQFDLIVSNPPYIASGVMAGLAPEVGFHDPALALDGGADGLEPYRVILRGARAHLKGGGALAVEIGFDQGEAVAALFASAGFSGVGVEKDLADHDRIVVGQTG
jgi:release factor glutamine methyltransferase